MTGISAALQQEKLRVCGIILPPALATKISKSRDGLLADNLCMKHECQLSQQRGHATGFTRHAPPRRRPSPRSATGTQYHSRNTEGFTVLYGRWVVERTFAWMSRVGVGEGLRAELGELGGVGATGRAPLHDAPNRKVDIMLIIITIMRI